MNTPETDAMEKYLFSMNGQMQTICVHIEDARKMELQRDQLRKVWDDMRLALIDARMKIQLLNLSAKNPEPSPSLELQIDEAISDYNSIARMTKGKQERSAMSDKPKVYHAPLCTADDGDPCTCSAKSSLAAPTDSAVGGDFYNGIEWLACWMLDNVEGETITEEQLRPWAAKAWEDHLKRQNDSSSPTGRKPPKGNP